MGDVMVAQHVGALLMDLVMNQRRALHKEDNCLPRESMSWPSASFSMAVFIVFDTI